jgi:hypothetical protein
VNPKSLVSAVSILALAGCAGRAPNPVAVSQTQDTGMSCAAIHAEIESNTRQIAELGSEQGGKIAQNIAAGAAGLFIPVLWFAMDFQGAATKEIAALEQRNGLLGEMALERCGQEALAPTPSQPVAVRPRSFLPQQVVGIEPERLEALAPTPRQPVVVGQTSLPPQQLVSMEPEQLVSVLDGRYGCVQVLESQSDGLQRC